VKDGILSNVRVAFAPWHQRRCGPRKNRAGTWKDSASDEATIEKVAGIARDEVKPSTTCVPQPGYRKEMIHNITKGTPPCRSSMTSEFTLNCVKRRVTVDVRMNALPCCVMSSALPAPIRLRRRRVRACTIQVDGVS